MFEFVDYLILFTFLLGFTGFGWYQSRYNISNTDYFLGSKTIPWPVAMFSIVATETSVLTFISIPGVAYRGNWVFLQLAIGYIIGRFLVSYILLPIYFQKGVLSIYEILGYSFWGKYTKSCVFYFFNYSYFCRWGKIFSNRSNCTGYNELEFNFRSIFDRRGYINLFFAWWYKNSDLGRWFSVYLIYIRWSHINFLFIKLH